MAKVRKTGRTIRKPTAPKVSRKMDRVRPLAAEPAMGRRYDPGFKSPSDVDHEVGEGEPEVNG
jgi:hypothetical protein